MVSAKLLSHKFVNSSNRIKLPFYGSLVLCTCLESVLQVCC